MAVAEIAEIRGASRIENPSKVGVVGSGSREHAMLDYMRELSDAQGNGTRFYAIPGNPGTAEVATNIDGVGPTEIDRVVGAVKDNGIEFVAIGPERPMAMGLTDALEESGVQVFGHMKDRMFLEASKADATRFMERHGIPHPESRIVTNPDQARYIFDQLESGEINWKDIVVKADGLAEGKGVSLPQTREEALEITLAMLRGESFGDAGKRVVLQEKVTGVEVSMIGFVSNEMGFLVPARDYKSLYEDGEGPNTGGMGAYAPNEVITDKIYEQFMREIAIPTQKGMREEGLELTGPVYFGLMITQHGPVVLEYNMRFGDPETAVQLALFRGDLLGVMQDTRNETLDSRSVRSSQTQAAVGVFAVSEGYPGKPITGRKITGTDEAIYYADLYHAGTKKVGEDLVTSGGRVLMSVRSASTKEKAAELAYTGIGKVLFDGMHTRADIGE